MAIELSSSIKNNLTFIELSDFIITNNLIKNETTPFNIALQSKENEDYITLYDNKNEYTFVIDADFDKGYIFFISSFIDKTKINPLLSHRLIEFFISKTDNKEELNPIFTALSWTLGSKGLILHNAFNDFSDELRHLVAQKKVSINEAYIFHTAFLSGYDPLLKMIDDKLSFSTKNAILRELSEISKKYGTGAEKLAAEIRAKSTDGMELTEIIREMRFPFQTKYAGKLESYIAGLTAKCKGTSINYSKPLEEEDYTLNIKFNSRSNLREKLSALIKNIDSGSGEDLFKLDTLFKDLEI